MADKAIGVKEVSLTKNTMSDQFVGWRHYRTITAEDVGAVVTSTTPNLFANNSSNVIALPHCKAIMFRVWSNVSGGTVSLQWFSQAADGPATQSGTNENKLTKSLPVTILATAITCSGASCVNFNPVTGEADASNTWYEMSNHVSVSTSYSDNRITEYPQGAATGYNKMFQFDMLGESKVLALCYGAPSSSGTVLIAYRIVE